MTPLNTFVLSSAPPLYNSQPFPATFRHNVSKPRRGFHPWQELTNKIIAMLCQKGYL